VYLVIIYFVSKFIPIVLYYTLLFIIGVGGGGGGGGGGAGGGGRTNRSRKSNLNSDRKRAVRSGGA